MQFAEVKREFVEFRGELKREVAELRGDLSSFRADVNGRFTLLQWMVGFSLAGLVSIIFKLFA